MVALEQSTYCLKYEALILIITGIKEKIMEKSKWLDVIISWDIISIYHNQSGGSDRVGITINSYYQ